MNEVIKIIIIILITITLILMAFTIYIVIKHRPIDNFVKGTIEGKSIDIFNSEFTYITYDSNEHQKRKEELDIYLFKKFTINLKDDEEFIHIFCSKYSRTNRSPAVTLFPRGNITRKNSKIKLNYLRIPTLRLYNNILKWNKISKYEYYYLTFYESNEEVGVVIVSNKINELRISEINNLEIISNEDYETKSIIKGKGKDFKLNNNIQYRVEISGLKYNYNTGKYENLYSIPNENINFLYLE